MKSFNCFIVLLLVAACNNAPAPESNTQEVDHSAHENMEAKDTTAIKTGQRVFFENLTDGDVIKLPFVVKFGVEGMGVEPAQGVNPDKGHHHLLINQGAVEAGVMVPMGKESEGYYHFGKGQLSDTLTLSKYPMLTPGIHKLRLQFANGLHLSYGPAMSAEVRIEVQ